MPQHDDPDPATWEPSPVDLSQPNVARLYDYLLGGTSNFTADRRVGDQIKQALPEVRVGVQGQRAMLRRVVRHLVGELRIRQLIDIGSGLPTAGNVHEAARELDADARVAYVDNDPIVLAQARALLTGNQPVDVFDGDLHHPAQILGQVTADSFVDLDRPVGLLLCGILHHIRDDENPRQILATLRAAIPSGSYIFIHHLVDVGEHDVADAQAAMQQGLGRGQFRQLDDVRAFFEGFDLVPPGLVPVPEWHPEPDTPALADNPVLRLGYGGVARKP